MPLQVHKHKRHPPPRKISVFKEVEHTPSRLTGSTCPVNLVEAKEKFLKHGILPQFKLKASASSENLEPSVRRRRAQVNFDYFKEAKGVLDTVKTKFGDGCKYIVENYGERIDILEGTEVLAEYLKDNNCEGEMTIYWTPQLECTAKMMWHGPNLRYNRPELRRYSLVIKNSTENGYLRQKGLQCLANHEIGTHYMRMINDGFQPWYSDRKKFGLRAMRSRESAATEEGLASINTLINAKYKYIWGPALTYYIACMASEMSFRELYDHLEAYLPDPEQRWKSCMRVKRHVSDPNAHGGSGADQVYFEGIVEILRNIENIDFTVLYSGKVCVDEIPRVRRVARTDCIKTPKFLMDIERYKKTLHYMAWINGLGPKPERKPTNVPATTTNNKPINNKGRHTPKFIKKKSAGVHRKFEDQNSNSTSPQLYKVKRTPLVEPLPRITQVTEEILNPLDDIEEDDEGEDEITTCPPNNSYASKPQQQSYQLLGRPKSTPNKIVQKPSIVEAEPPPKRIDWFGMLERKWEY